MLSTGIVGLKKASIPTDLTSLANMGFGAVSFSALVVFLPITSVSSLIAVYHELWLNLQIGIANLVHEYHFHQFLAICPLLSLFTIQRSS